MAILVAYTSGVRMLSPLPAAAEVPDAIAAPGEIPVTSVQAVGAQVYECQYNPAGKLVWQFREPVATLLIAGKTVGRHYAGPTWEMSDGSAVSAKVLARAPGATANDIPLLKLEVTARHGSGKLGNVTTIQRLNTQGGNADAACELIRCPAERALHRRLRFLQKSVRSIAVNWRGRGFDEHRDNQTPQQRHCRRRFLSSGGISPPKGSDKQILQAHQTGQPTTYRCGHDHRQLRFADAA